MPRDPKSTVMMVMSAGRSNQESPLSSSVPSKTGLVECRDKRGGEEERRAKDEVAADGRGHPFGRETLLPR